MKNIKWLSLLTALILSVVFILTACGGGSGSTTAAPAAAPETTVAAAEESAAPETPAAETEAAPAAADGSKSEILIGMVAPMTGPLASFTEALEYNTEMCLEKINADGGIYIESYGKKLPLRVIFADSESDATKASEAAGKLVQTDKVDILIGTCTPDNTSPVSAVAERAQIPCLVTDAPYESWAASGDYKWSYAAMFSVEDLVNGYVEAMDKMDTNKVIGYLFDSDVDGVTFSEVMRPVLEEHGYTIVDPGRFPSDTTDFTSLIPQYKEAGCDLVVANQLMPNFNTAWSQFFQIGYVPKCMVIGKAILFGSDVAALGEGKGEGLMNEIHWHRSFPYTSSLLGMTCEEIAAAYEEKFEKQYPLSEFGYDIATYEILYEALSTCKDLEPETILNAIGAVDYEGVYGHLAFNGTHVVKCPIVTAQWQKSDTWDYDPVIIGVSRFTEIPSNDPIVIPNTTIK